MLIAALLNKVAGTTVPGEQIAHHFWQLRDSVKELLDDEERCKVRATRHRRHKI